MHNNIVRRTRSKETIRTLKYAVRMFLLDVFHQQSTRIGKLLTIRTLQPTGRVHFRITVRFQLFVVFPQMTQHQVAIAAREETLCTHTLEHGKQTNVAQHFIANLL